MESPDAGPSGLSGGNDIFRTTRWTLVLAAGARASPQSARALEEICRAYWYPIYAYIRRRGHAPADAEDLTQEFFRRFLAGRWIEDADPRKGKLRAFLITAVKRFLAKEWRRGMAQKRGGGVPHLPIDTASGEERYAASGRAALPADGAFDREWAVAVLDTTLSALEQEYAEAGRADQFAALKDGLVLSRDRVDYAAVAARLGGTDGAARVAVHRLRKRFRERYREEVAQTLPEGVGLDEEIRHLANSLVPG